MAGGALRVYLNLVVSVAVAGSVCNEPNEACDATIVAGAATKHVQEEAVNVNLVQASVVLREKLTKVEQEQIKKTMQSCANDWDVFGRPMTGSQVNPSRCMVPQDFSNFQQAYTDSSGDSAWSMPFVSRAHRFGFCAIPKVASSSWRHIFAEMYYNDTDFEFKKTESADERPSAPSAEDLLAVFSDEGATIGTMIREPLARFVSSFLQKCNHTAGDISEQDMINCPPLTRGPPSMEDVVEWFLTQDPAMVGSHFRLQSEFCELRTRINEYSFVLFYTKPSAAVDARCFMELAGVERFDTLGSAHNNQPVWTELCGEILAPGVNSCTDDEEEAHLKLLFTDEAAKRMIAHMHQDYQTFNLVEPSWITEATGELYRTKITQIVW